MQDSVAYTLPWLCTMLWVFLEYRAHGHTERKWPLIGRAWKGGSSMPRQRQRRALCTVIPNPDFISQSREVLDEHGKFPACQDWPAITPMPVRWHLVLLPFVRPAAADWLSNSASLKLRMRDALMARRRTLTYLGKLAGHHEMKQGGAPLETYLHSDWSCSRADTGEHPTH